MALNKLAFNDVKFQIAKDLLKTNSSDDQWFDQKRVKNAIEQIINGYDDKIGRAHV